MHGLFFCPCERRGREASQPFGTLPTVRTLRGRDAVLVQSCAAAALWTF
jgi:hypothetical protein